MSDDDSFLMLSPCNHRLLEYVSQNSEHMQFLMFCNYLLELFIVLSFNYFQLVNLTRVLADNHHNSTPYDGLERPHTLFRLTLEQQSVKALKQGITGFKIFLHIILDWFIPFQIILAFRNPILQQSHAMISALSADLCLHVGVYSRQLQRMIFSLLLTLCYTYYDTLLGFARVFLVYNS